MDSVPAQAPKEVLVNPDMIETAEQKTISPGNLKAQDNSCSACSELDEVSSSEHGSANSSYQEWADAEPVPVYYDDLQEQEKARVKKQMQTELLAPLSPVLQQQLGPRVLALKQRELQVLTGESLTLTQKKDLVNSLEARAACPGEALQEFDRWLHKGVYQDRVTLAEEHQQLQRQQDQLEQHEKEALQDRLERQVKEWRADAHSQAPHRPWQDTFLARHAMAQPYLERAVQKQHSSHTHLFKSFLVAGRWAGFPYWQHPPTAEPGKHVPLGEPSSCSLCCHALGIPKLEATPVAAQHRRLERWFGSCLGPSVKDNSSSTVPQASVTASSSTARNTSAAARLSIVAKQGQNWESDLIDPARLFVQHAVQETFGRADALVQPDRKPSRGSLTRGSSIYWELYAPSMAGRRGSGQGAEVAQATKSFGQQSGRRLRKLFSRRGA